MILLRRQMPLRILGGLCCLHSWAARGDTSHGRSIHFWKSFWSTQGCSC